MKYKVKFIKHEEVANGTRAFYFEKPADFSFIAGQFADWTLIDPKETDDEGTTRAFSIIASPDEAHIGFATRMRDTAFKRQVQEFREGSEMSIEGPFGNFILHENVNRPAVFLVGGIGITPFMSIIKDALDRGSGHTMHLFYSNRRPDDAAFLEELQELDREHENFHLTPTMTNMDDSEKSWSGETGYITKEMIDRAARNLESAVYYTAGPAVMVSAMRKLLNESGISNDDIRTEEFSGY